MTFRTSTSPIKAGSNCGNIIRPSKSALFVFSVILLLLQPLRFRLWMEKVNVSVVASVTLIFFTTLLYPINE